MSKYVSRKDFFCGDFSHVLSRAYHQDFNLAWNFHRHILTDDVKKMKSNLVARKTGWGFPGACKELGQFPSGVGCRWVSASLLGQAKQAERLSPSSLLSSLPKNPSDATINLNLPAMPKCLKSKQGRCPMLSAFVQMKPLCFCFFNYWTAEWSKWKRDLDTPLMSAVI